MERLSGGERIWADTRLALDAGASRTGPRAAPRRLPRQHRLGPCMAAARLPATRAGWLAGLAVDDDLALGRAVQRLHRQGLGAELIGLDWLAPAARELGRRWESDACSFVDVTIGVARLQCAWRQLDPNGRPGRRHALAPAPSVLLVPAPGEQHSFGLGLVAEVFLRAGWQVTGGAAGAGIDPVAFVAAVPLDVLGISVGSRAQAAAVPDLCAALRAASCHPGLSLLVGGPLLVVEPDLEAGALGADAVASDARAALVQAERLLAGAGHGVPLDRAAALCTGDDGSMASAAFARLAMGG